MSEISKDALLGMYQQRMDKCMTEQFWIVAAISALDAGILSQSSLPAGLPRWLVIAGLTLATVYGIYFVRHRHITFYDYRRNVSELVADCPFAPPFLKETRKAWKISNITGVGFYSVWIFGGYVAAMCVL